MAVRIGYASGAYDLFHIGHLNLLKHARSQCDYLIAGVASTEMTQRLKGTTPVIPLAERLEIVRSVRYVDAVVVDTHVNKADTWQEVGFNIFFKGDDWKGTEKGERLEQDMARIGVEVVYFPYTVSTSSTVLRRALTLLDGGRAPDTALKA
ncbi:MULTISPECIES: adenylyltransferase/cytidyltransferase family protein [Arthrobacter]|uniref:Adenylyltransferase/cytidyltransferase family protein n=1 Tax=Arthrobacter sunyaminii TaxID=2816859 RepID=A0A975S7B1_9MICC|nr:MULTISPECIES: adenylyltransferase/cytidyltransferase family protein [Arthrobacter]MBO0896438.1 adenylyltransferase/cytidyltransferase family protein [Arthrobacter sunyaminii]MBO0908143.1 adenylyltransferase/cytidyltransferase family protein [Arthrobacter sunyaminii]QWQ37154.1 adenylyltransferase/cytidyltransferase family protein [Arthrobacter sunyaminii]